MKLPILLLTLCVLAAFSTRGCSSYSDRSANLGKYGANQILTDIGDSQRWSVRQADSGTTIGFGNPQ